MEITSGRLPSKAARDNWRDFLDAVMGGAHVVITRSGKDVAAVIPIADWHELSAQLEDLASAAVTGSSGS